MLVCAVTVVLSSASAVEPVDAEDDAEPFSSEFELEDDDSTAVCPSDAADELELAAAEDCDPAPSADDPLESEPPEGDEDSCDG